MNHDSMTHGAPWVPTTEELDEFLNTATSEGRNFYYEGQHGAEDGEDAEQAIHGEARWGHGPRWVAVGGGLPSLWRMLIRHPLGGGLAVPL